MSKYKTGNPQKLNISISNARAISCILLVVYHSLVVIKGLHENEISHTYYIILNTIIHMLQFIVPLFLMISGALLLNPQKHISIDHIFKKYIARVFWALVIFTIIYYFIDVIFHHIEFDKNFIAIIINKILTNGSWGNLWYLYALIGIYLLLPFYKKIANSISYKEYIYLFAIYILFYCIVKYLQMFDINIGFYIEVFTIYPLYFFMGDFINRFSKCSKKDCYLILIIALLAIVIMSILNVKIKGDENYIFSYSSILTIVYSYSIYSIFIKHELLNFKNKINKLLYKIDKASFLIYLIHLIPIRIIFVYYNFNIIK